MNNVDKEYFRIADLILTKGKRKDNRTGVPTISIFGAQSRYDLSEGFPILTTKKINFAAVTHELLWFLSGDTNIKYLVDNNVKIWNEWPYKKYCDSLSQYQYRNLPKLTQDEFVENIKNSKDFADQWGNLGAGTYGRMWRDFPSDAREDNGARVHGVDQIETVLDQLRKDPDSRRIIVTAWHPYYVNKAALPACHFCYQFYTEELTLEEREEIYSNTIFKKGYGIGSPYNNDNQSDDLKHANLDSIDIPKRRLSLNLTQRSQDYFLGAPFNISSYCLLIHLFCRELNMIPGEFINSIGDVHLYENHIEQIKFQMQQESKPLPQLLLRPSIENVLDFKFDDILLENYQHGPVIKAPVAV